MYMSGNYHGKTRSRRNREGNERVVRSVHFNREPREEPIAQSRNVQLHGELLNKLVSLTNSSEYRIQEMEKISQCKPNRSSDA